VITPTAEQWNERHRVGVRVRYWKGAHEGDPSGEAPTRTPAQMLGGHTPVVWVEGEPACIALTHIEPSR
jgi:hypothetical protein